MQIPGRSEDLIIDMVDKYHQYILMIEKCRPVPPRFSGEINISEFPFTC